MVTQVDIAGTTKLLYNSYLVRFWKDTLDGPWRASVQSVQTGEIVRFGSPQALYAFFEAQATYSEWANAPPDQCTAEER